MIWLNIIFLFLTSCYAIISVLLFIGVSRLRKNAALPDSSSDCPFVSILVAARNEEQNIANCLESLVNQQYPSDLYEIVIVNDRSVDKTSEIINEFREKYRMVKYIDIESNLSGLTGKQNALNEGLKICTGEIILNTDADCIAEPLWIQQTVAQFAPEVGLTLGFSTVQRLDGSNSLFSNLQSLDMLFLMDSDAGAIGMNVAVSGLGRNLAYRRQILNSIDYAKMGYTVTEDAALVSGIAKNTDWKIAVVYDKNGAVTTVAEENLRQLVSQRFRWVIGGHTTKIWSQIPLYAAFAFHFGIAILIPLMFFMHSFVTTTLIAFLIKAILDFGRCWRVCKEFGRMDLLKLIILYEFFMISYSIFVGFGGIFVKKIKWKGELYTRSAQNVDNITGG